MMSIDQLPSLLQNGVCPFTGKQYDCARCTHNPTRHECPAVGETSHFNLCITHPIDGRGWRPLLTFFDRRERDRAKQTISWLLQLGATCLPVGNCDTDHFCFRHGCIGHPHKESEAAQ